MALWKRGKTWYADLTDSAGGRHRLSLKTRDEKVAREKHAALELALLRGETLMADPKGPTLKDAFDRAFRMHYSALKSSATAGYHRQHVYEVIPPTTPLASLTREMIDGIVERQLAKGNTRKTINRTLQTLGHVLTMAVEARMLKALPCKMPITKEAKGRIRVFTEAEERAILGYYVDTGNVPMVSLCRTLADTGLRLGEALNRDLMDLDRGARTVTVWETKGGPHRTVPLTLRAAVALGGLLESPPMDADQVHREWNKMRTALGKAGDREFVPHTFRHTCATRLAKAGVPMPKIMLWMGHKDPKTTMIYVNMTAHDLSAAVLEKSAPACDEGCVADVPQDAPQVAGVVESEVR